MVQSDDRTGRVGGSEGYREKKHVPIGSLLVRPAQRRSVVIGAKAKVNPIFKRACEKAKRVCEVASFYQYAVADGIHRILFGSRNGPRMPPPKVRIGQLVLPFLAPPP